MAENTSTNPNITFLELQNSGRVALPVAAHCVAAEGNGQVA